MEKIFTRDVDIMQELISEDRLGEDEENKHNTDELMRNTEQGDQL